MTVRHAQRESLVAQLMVLLCAFTLCHDIARADETVATVVMTRGDATVVRADGRIEKLVVELYHPSGDDPRANPPV